MTKTIYDELYYFEFSFVKIYNPIFSIVIIIIQLILSIIDYFQIEKWRKENPEFDALLSLVIHYDSLFLFVFTIGVLEMLTKPNWFKNLIRILLIGIVLGYEFSGLIPIKDFKFGVYNTAWFSSVIAFVLIIFFVGNELSDKFKREEIE